MISRDKSGNYLVQLRDGLLCSISYANMKGYLLDLAASVYTSEDYPPHRLVGMDENGNYRLALGPQSFGSVTPVDMRAHLDRLANEARKWLSRGVRRNTKPKTLKEYFFNVEAGMAVEQNVEAVSQSSHSDNTLDSDHEDMSIDSTGLNQLPTRNNRQQSSETFLERSYDGDQDMLLPLLFAGSDLVPIISLNVGRAGICKSFMQLQQIFASRPGVVMFQETWLKKSALSLFCSFA